MGGFVETVTQKVTGYEPPQVQQVQQQAVRQEPKGPTTAEVDDLTKKMKDMINLSTDERREMGLKGREKIERGFSERVTVARIIEIINRLIDKSEDSKNPCGVNGNV